MVWMPSKTGQIIVHKPDISRVTDICAACARAGRRVRGHPIRLRSYRAHTEIFGAIEQAGESEGIQFVFDRIARTPNTVDSHRLIEFAGQRGAQDQVVEALFRRYFEQGEDIGDRTVLEAAAVDGGLNKDEVRRFLAGSDGAEHVRRESEAASRMGVSGVPCFIFEGRYAVSGAQPPDVFERVFELAAAAAENSADSPPPAT